MLNRFLPKRALIAPTRNLKILLLLGLALLVAWWLPPARSVLLGVAGAVFANATGAGGGVVFIPWFHSLGFGEREALATSFGIQCFGMSAGALTWLAYYWAQKANHAAWGDFGKIVGLCAVASIAGIWLGELMQWTSPTSMRSSFKVFSVVLGLAIIFSVTQFTQRETQLHLSKIDALALTLIAIIGGVITGWLSVAVGELIAFYLIFRRYDTRMAVAIAVVVTALTVWSVAPIHLGADSEINWGVVQLAGPGAILGGISARFIVTALSARRLKLFFGCCLILIGAAG